VAELRPHLEAVHRQSLHPVTCYFCGVSFASKKSLFTHVAKHLEQQPQIIDEEGEFVLL
jgi:hypothetical protein